MKYLKIIKIRQKHLNLKKQLNKKNYKTPKLQKVSRNKKTDEFKKMAFSDFFFDYSNFCSLFLENFFNFGIISHQKKTKKLKLKNFQKIKKKANPIKKN